MEEIKMYVSEIRPEAQTYTQAITNKTPREKDQNSRQSEVSLSYRYEKLEINIEYTTYSFKNKPAKAENANSPHKMETSSILNEKSRIRDEILEQTKQLLAEFFEQNPEALEEVQQGQIPEFFNVDNTARRMLNIFFSKYNGEDPGSYAEYVKSIIEQAYSDVESMVGGGLPDIVQQTREKVFQLIDDFANGEDITNFLNE